MLLQLLTGSSGAGTAAEVIETALMQNGNLAGGVAANPYGMVHRLTQNLLNLTTEARKVDPQRINAVAAGQIQEAVSAYNELIDHSTDAFISNPPVELAAIYAVLRALDEAAWKAASEKP
jgi:hypothetical protein